MSTQPNDGGSAFPCAIETGKLIESVDMDARSVSVFPEYKRFSGMSLRDYFAAAALQGILMNYTTQKFGASEETVAQYAYRYADAMLAERAKGGAK